MKNPGFSPLARRALAVLAAGLPLAATAATQAEIAARQAASLFVAGCVRFSGDTAGLRAWATDINLPALPPPGQAGFLQGAAGTVFDASNPAGKYVLVSRDDGGCAVLAEAVDIAALPTEAEAALRAAALHLSPAGDRADPVEDTLRHRTYHAALGARSWTLVLSYGQGATTGQAMLSATAR